MKEIEELSRLTEKLKKEGEISQKEADWIFSLFSDKNLKTKLNPNSRRFDRFLSNVVNRWFEAVYDLLKDNKRGNFVTTIPPKIPLKRLGFENSPIETNFLNKCRKLLSDEESFTLMMVGEKTYQSFPEKIKKLFREESYGYKKFYCFYNFRAGIYSCLDEITKNFKSIITSEWHDLCRFGFKLAVGAQEPDGSQLICKKEAYFMAIASFMKASEILPICVQFSDRNSILAVEKDNYPIVKKVLEFPFEELVQSAVSEGIISPKMAKSLRNNNSVYFFPAVEFSNMCAKILKHIADTHDEFIEIEQEIEEGKWFDTIR